MHINIASAFLLILLVVVVISQSPWNTFFSSVPFMIEQVSKHSPWLRFPSGRLHCIPFLRVLYCGLNSRVLFLVAKGFFLTVLALGHLSLWSDFSNWKYCFFIFYTKEIMPSMSIIPNAFFLSSFSYFIYTPHSMSDSPDRSVRDWGLQGASLSRLHRRPPPRRPWRSNHAGQTRKMREW
jgi:hypothetical protein